LLAIWKVFTTS